MSMRIHSTLLLLGGGPHKPSRRALRLALAMGALALAALLIPARLALAQDAKPAERVYNHPQIEVQKALDTLRAYDTERLPVLDGFVNANASTLDHFENPHYQFRIDIEGQNPTQTLVVVSAKITAWFGGDDSSHSQYVVIPSNGRLESDFLDRLSIYLEKGRPAPAAVPDAPAGLPAAANGAESSSSQPSGQPSSSGNIPPGGFPAPSSSPPASSAAASPAAPAVSANDPATIATEISSVRAQRAAVEDHEHKLQQQISELQSVSQNQKFLPDIAVVRAAQTPVFSSADETSQILFRADPDDEFEITDAQTRFVHVKLEKGDGWIRISQLRGPNEVDDADESTGNFNASNEEIKPFQGQWAALDRKSVV